MKQYYCSSFVEPKKARRIRLNERSLQKSRQIQKIQLSICPSTSFSWKDLKGNIRYGIKTSQDKEDWILTRARMYRDNLAVCSCFMCGNPRKWNKGETSWGELKNAKASFSQIREEKLEKRYKLSSK